ncbi:MAG: DUF3048 domain-containing protein [Chloroflexi bacterium]|nr:DUF3048 domain-containing protein [Chloroflexota bacterium]
MRATAVIVVGVLAAVALASLVMLTPQTEAESGDGLQATAPPTNTLRATAPPTNTLRPSPPPTNTLRPSPSATPTVTRTPTPTPTQTPSPTATFTPTFTPSPTATTVGPDEYPEDFNPLTGLPYPSDEARDRRTLIVKVSNFPPVVRPQSGLNEADIVFEYEVEGGVTRFAAIYRSQGTERVGSIRSARLLDLELVVMFQGLLAYSGANAWIDNYIMEADWFWRALTPQHGVNCPPFCRSGEEDKPYEHTLYGNTYEMWDVAEERQVNQGMAFRGLAFSYEPDPGGVPAQDIYIEYWNDLQTTRWQYNPGDGRYYRWNTDIPHVDAVTGNQIATDNVVILAAEHIDRPDIYESETAGIVIETALWGNGDAWLLRDGQWWEGTWWHAQGRTGLWLTFPDGETMHLKPGQTWFEVVRPFNLANRVTISEQPIDMQATAEAIFAQQTQAAVQTATAIAPYITPTPSPQPPPPGADQLP